MVKLESFGDSLNVAVVGATGGIGNAVVTALQDHPKIERVFAFSRRSTNHAGSPNIVPGHLDLTQEDSIRAAADLAAASGPLHLVFVATGMLHQGSGVQPEKTWGALTAESMEQAFRINSMGPALIAKHFLPLLAKDQKAVFAALSARVGSISDNQLGGWYSYRASKSALNMFLKCSAIELARRNASALCIGLHPGTVDTALSEPFQRGVPDGKLFPPSLSADHLLRVIDGLTVEDSGKVFAWDGAEIPS
ncbi:SDR family NAD(P)-dependent oxidoreductase [Denitrobaculum tricleocarpae]|uniref:SDR family NAD(P)-dependent oxidoreductase n=1 Tax=Denitrobaculum tricleocarpae TaxID=2591009 RepID=A0A545U220_9PROT|nr:SDR family NAD(P)-dependent oxidoreductase [Denitrobaculum tricleocarpae]TQV83484.1 SDR family NAD(P)-dependent oxidoreductase [Denitrobaculum tricleocarpae]